MLSLHPALWTLVAVLSASQIELISSTQPSKVFEAWLCWASLWLASRFCVWRLRARGAQNSNDGEPKESTPWWTEVLPLSIFIVELIQTSEDVGWVAPLTTMTTHLLLSYWSTAGQPSYELASSGFLPDLNPSRTQKISLARTWLLLAIFGCITLLSATILFLASPFTAALQAGAVGFLFMISQTVVYCLLTRKLLHTKLPSDLDHFEWKDMATDWFARLSFRVFAFLTLYLALNPSSLPLSATFCILALLKTVRWLSIPLTIYTASPLIPSVTATFAASAPKIFVQLTMLRSLFVFFVAAFTFTQGYLDIPPSFRKRWMLVALLLIPAFGLISRNAIGLRPSHWMTSHRHILTPSPDERPSSSHPVVILAATAKSKFAKLLDQQSQTLSAAITEYRRRYRREPPPGFDKWFDLAQKNAVPFIDEFDIMMQPLEPMWGISPSDLRARVESALQNSPESLIKVSIQDHKAIFAQDNYAPWMSAQIRSWLDSEGLQVLPDIVFAINTFDEPRVQAPNDALETVLRAARQSSSSKAPTAGHQDDKSSNSVQFLRAGKQSVWQEIILSCPVDSPARIGAYFENPLAVKSDLGFVINCTHNQDVCSNPVLQDHHGIFLSPDTLQLTHVLVPIFSQAKASSFQDLLYPSPWYAAKYDSHEYDEVNDVSWEEKRDELYWTGSTTGGFATEHNWHMLHRQRMVRLTNGDLGRRITLLNETRPGRWTQYNATMDAVAHLFNTKISAVIQCDDEACETQKKAFNRTEELQEDLSISYRSKYNLDVDGNGFSGRFYRILLSKGLPVKQTIFQEWHDDRLIPWLHYVPLSMEMNELAELMRFLTMTDDGKRISREIADESARWARQALRKVDMTLVFLRLLLEYARLVDPNRELLKCC